METGRNLLLKWKPTVLNNLVLARLKNYMFSVTNTPTNIINEIDYTLQCYLECIYIKQKN